MALTNTELSEWLQKQIGQTLDIRKGELTDSRNEISDMDQIMLHLDDVLVRRTNHPDDYVADEELVLKGTAQPIRRKAMYRSLKMRMKSLCLVTLPFKKSRTD